MWLQIQSMTEKDKLWIRLMKLGAKFGCHQRPERSFVYHGYQFPICARCTGILLSTLLAYLIYPVKHFSWVTNILMSSTVLIDGLIQYAGIKTSTNRRRFVTDCIGGFGWAMLRLRFYSCLFDFLLIQANTEVVYTL